MGNDPSFKAAIISLADALLKKGWGLVYGGGRRGLMGRGYLSICLKMVLIR